MIPEISALLAGLKGRNLLRTAGSRDFSMTLDSFIKPTVPGVPALTDKTTVTIGHKRAIRVYFVMQHAGPHKAS